MKGATFAESWVAFAYVVSRRASCEPALPSAPGGVTYWVRSVAGQKLEGSLTLSFKLT